MKKQIKLNKKTIKKLKLELKPKNDRKAAPALAVQLEGDEERVPTNGTCESSNPWWTC